MNKELLFNLYAIHSPSGGEKRMRRFIKRYIRKNCGEDVTVEQDNAGNILITKGSSDTYPCLAAHIDQVQRQHSKDFTVVQIGDDVIGWSPKCHEQQGLGADDKNGVFICLECLRKYDVLKVAFFVGEEVGCKGSSVVDLQFFKDCRFIIEPDRRDSSDLITSMFCGAVCSKDFVDAIHAQDYGYKEAEGTITDVGELVQRGVGISCLNLSCGYYEAHSDHELTVLSHLENCLRFVEHIVEACTDVYPFEQYRVSYAGYGSSLGKHHGYYDGGYDDEMYYYDGGYYDEDMSLMEDYLRTCPELTLDTIKANYMDNFHATWFFDKQAAEDTVSDIYRCILDEGKQWWKDWYDAAS